MGMVVWGKARGAPGLSTTWLVAQELWPRPALGVEADSDGGAMALRYGLGREPGLSTLTPVALAGASEPGWLLAHAQSLPNGQPVVVAPEDPAVVGATLRDGGAVLGRMLAGADRDVLVDCGRLTADGPTAGLLGAAGLVVLLARSTVVELHAAARLARALQPRVAAAGLVVVGDRPYGPEAVARQLGVDVIGVIPDDPRTAAQIDEAGGVGRAGRSRLVRNTGELARVIADWLTAPLSTVPREGAEVPI